MPLWSGLCPVVRMDGIPRAAYYSYRHRKRECCEPDADPVQLLGAGLVFGFCSIGAGGGGNMGRVVRGSKSRIVIVAALHRGGNI